MAFGLFTAAPSPDPFDAEGPGRFTFFSGGRSTTVPQAPQAKHLPCHFGVSFPHSVQ